MSFRARFFLIVLVASVVPLALVGFWLTGSAHRSGEELLRQRLSSALEEAVVVVTSQWIHHRSVLLFVAEDPEIQVLLEQEGRATTTGMDGIRSQDRVPGAGDLTTRFPTVDPAVRSIAVLGREGPVVSHLERRLADPGGQGSAPDGRTLLLELPVYRRLDGSRLGTLRVAVEPALLLPPDRLPATAAGTILTLVDPAGRALSPAPIQLPGADADRFVWAGEEWMAVRRQLVEPSVTLVAAATLGPALGPFRRTARRGTLVLLAVSLLAVVSTAWLTARMTRSLGALSDAADAVAGGDLARRIPVTSRDEVGRVAGAFNQMAERLRRTMDRMAGRESLAAVGEFAAGLAHEVRNPLTSVQINLQFVESQLPPDSPLRDAQRKALAEIQRLDSTVRDALRVARSGRVEPQAVDLREQLEAAAGAARPTFDARGANLSVELPASPVELQGDPGALEQLFLNLLQNAGEALETGGQAAVQVELDGADVRVRISDDGPGMPPSVRDRAFEPLFSTRVEGTGLGLPIAQRIVMAHEGTIRVETAPGEGTVIEVTLPARLPL